jgi:molecular chaperone GrpE
MDSRKISLESGRPQKPEEPAFRIIDKRHFLDDGAVSSPGSAAETEPRYPTYVEELISKVKETERRFADRVKQVDQEIARSKARIEADFERRLALGKQDLLLPFLEVLDNLERALKAAAADRNDDLVQGLNLTVALFRARLRAHSVERIEVLGLPFDPNLSQAVGVVAVEDPAKDGIVVEELLPGYRMGDSLLRPAQVRVGDRSLGDGPR